MRLAFNPAAADKFSRLVDVRLAGSNAPIASLGTELILLTSSFVAAGGDK